MSAFVYMLRCSDGSYYVGSARDETLDKRVGEHQSGALGGYTSLRRPVELVYAEHCQFITDAIAAEQRIKGWGRTKKEALIRGDWASVQKLAKRPGARDVDSSQTKSLALIRYPQPPHAEVAGSAGPRSTHYDRASFEAELRSAPQDEEAGSFGAAASKGSPAHVGKGR